MPVPGSLEPRLRVEGWRRGSLPTMLPSNMRCLVPWAGKPHHGRSLSWEAHPDTTVTPGTSPAFPIYPGDTLAARPGSCQHCKPSLMRTRAFQALRPCLTSREDSVTVPSACRGVQIDTFLQKQIEIFLCTFFFSVKNAML